MKKRTKLSQRLLPNYTHGEEVMNMVTHIVGGGLGIIALVLCIIKAAIHGSAIDIVGAVIYGTTMVVQYAISSVYHGLHPSTAKKVLQIIDHCTIYMLIAGCYTPVLLSTICPVYPVLGWSLFVLEWGLAILATVLTAIDLKKYNVFSMICYIGLGWAIIPFVRQAMEVLTLPGFLLLLFGGITYTIGAVLYGIGGKMRWMHSVFHIFVVLGSLLQFFSIYFYALK